MTGYGKATGQYAEKNLVVELRSLNSKNFDLNLKMPSLYREKEMDLRSYLSGQLQRGKVECAIYYESSGTDRRVRFNTAVMDAYLDELQGYVNTRPELTAPEWMSILTRLPEVTVSERPELDEAEWQFIMGLLKQAHQRFTAFRNQEGESIYRDFKERLAGISAGLETVLSQKDERLQALRQRLEQSLDEISEKANLDESRLEQEMIYYLEKWDLNEEITRLRNHLEYFANTLEEKPGQGKKLGFIAQEMGREINTIGSKANHQGIQKSVVMMKDELEKIKEQVLNIL